MPSSSHNYIVKSIHKVDYRELNNLSQAQLSDKLQLLGIDIPKNSIQRIEKGRRTIREYELAGFSKVLKVSTDRLLEDFLNKLE